VVILVAKFCVCFGFCSHDFVGLQKIVVDPKLKKFVVPIHKKIQAQKKTQSFNLKNYVFFFKNSPKVCRFDLTGMNCSREKSPYRWPWSGKLQSGPLEIIAGHGRKIAAFLIPGFVCN
jgi:hypothetical protein